MKPVRQYWVIYYLIYVVCVVVLAGLRWQSLARGGDEAIFLLAAIFGVSVGTALLSAIILEGIGYMVLLIPDRIRKLKAEGREEGRQEGREEGLQEGLEQGREEGLERQKELQQQWMAWYERHQAALRDGQPFTEPPPGVQPSKNGK